MKLTYEKFLKIKNKKVRTDKENELIAEFFLSRDIDFKSFFNSNEISVNWPESFSVNVNYDAKGDTKYVILENKNKIKVFDSCSIHGPVKFVLFLIENGEYIAVDGSDHKDTWKI